MGHTNPGTRMGLEATTKGTMMSGQETVAYGATPKTSRKKIRVQHLQQMKAAGVSAQEIHTPAPAAAGTGAALKIGTADADKYYDQTMIVTGKVAQVTIRPTVTFLNMDKAYPDSPFTVVIFHGHSSFYGDANALRGKSVEIKGKIKSRKAR